MDTVEYYQEKLGDLLLAVKMIVDSERIPSADDIEKLRMTYVGYMATPGMLRMSGAPIGNFGISTKAIQQRLLQYNRHDLGDCVGEIYWFTEEGVSDEL